MDYMIFNVRTWSILCMRIHTGVANTDSESAQRFWLPVLLPGFELGSWNVKSDTTNWATPPLQIIFGFILIVSIDLQSRSVSCCFRSSARALRLTQSRMRFCVRMCMFPKYTYMNTDIIMQCAQPLRHICAVFRRYGGWGWGWKRQWHTNVKRYTYSNLHVVFDSHNEVAQTNQRKVSS